MTIEELARRQGVEPVAWVEQLAPLEPSLMTTGTRRNWSGFESSGGPTSLSPRPP